MNLFFNFKKDYFNYLVSIILPALISGISIPVFKHILGAEGYGQFSLWFNAVLIFTAVLSGWVFQSIIRFYPTSNNGPLFSQQAIKITLITQLIFFIPVVVVIYFISNDIMLAILCGLALSVTCFQFTVLAIIQSSFLSKKVIFSEVIRVVSYMLVALALLLLFGVHYLYALFISVCLSYLVSVIYLLNQLTNIFGRQATIYKSEVTIKPMVRQFLKYGAPLSLWFVFAYLLTYIDKLFILSNLGGQAQGNYQAIFDLLSRSITILISPVVTSIFPLLTSSYEKGDRNEIRRLLQRVILLEAGSLILAVVAYWIFGASLLSYILKTPDTFQYKLMGVIIITATFIWQIGILIQKRFELKKKSLYLLFMVIIAFLVQCGFYFITKQNSSPLIYPLGFLVAAVVYVLLISLSEIKKIAGKLSIKIASRQVPHN